MKRFLSFITLSVLIAGQVLADNNLPNQPIAADGGYVVQWDCATNDFHKNAAGEYANEMEYNETFVLAVNIEGTDLAAWIDRNPTNTGYARGVAVDFWRVADNKQFPGSISRLWHIRDHIYAATYNMQQVDEVWHPNTGSKTQFKARIFGFESPLGDKCSTAGSAPSSYKPNPQSNWYQWRGQWVEGYCSSKTGTANNDFGQAGEFFHFAPYTGAKTSQMPNPLLNSISYYQGKQYDNYRNMYYDSGHWVNYNGYASPFCTISPCAVPEYPQDYAVSASATSVCPVTSQTANITLAGSQTGYTYELYQDGQPTGETKAGTGSPLVWSDISEAGTYTVYSTQDGSNTPVQMIPCSGNSEITLTSPNSCCNIGGVTITISNTEPGMSETIHVRADITGTNDGNAKTFNWEVHGANGVGVNTNLANTITITTDNMTYSEFDISYTQWKDIAGAYQQGTNNGWYTFWCKVTEEGYTCNQQIDKQVEVQKELICPTFTWAIDGTEGLATPMYAGGWYDISVSTEAGAPVPTLTINGTGVTVVNTQTTGNTVTSRIELAGNANGVITLTAHTAANAAAGYKECDEERTPTIADCEGMTAETWKIEWFNYKTDNNQWPQYWIANGAPVYLRDNSGKLEADVAHTDGQDEWLFIATGEQKHGQPVYYIRNGLTRRYLHRGTQHGNIGSNDWEYAEALLDATLQASDDNYKWVLYPYNGDTLFACVADFTNTGDIEHNPYVLHTRSWEAASLFNYPLVATPGVACGKMGGQGGSPVFYMKHREHPQVSGVSLTTQLSWQGTAPAATVHLLPEGTCTYTATRTDQIHSLNSRIWYETTDATVATVDPATGAVTAVTEDGTCEIMVILNDTGCFAGDTLRYTVVIYECGENPTISSPVETCNKNQEIQLSLTHPAAANEAGTWVFTQNGGQSASISADGVFKATNNGTYTFYYQITNTAHPDCNRQSDPITITVKEKEDYPLPHQPKAADGTYVVLWDCEANDFAPANTMEWGETFVFAVNLAGTPLGNWVMQQPSQAGAVRTIAFDRWLDKGTKPEYKEILDQKQFDENACRLWLIRDTIFGATFNFNQIKLKNGSSHTPATGATTGIAARLFGVEAAHGDKCGNTPSVSKWWQWSDSEHSIYSEWNGQWQTGKYVSEDDEYLFHFAPYSGKSDPTYNAQVDDVRDRWYDNGHDFNLNGYASPFSPASPCPQKWPADQTVTIDKQTICVEDGETATLTLGGSETEWEYSLYNNGTLVDTKAGTGSPLTWTLDTDGTYSVKTTSTNNQHNDTMDSCTEEGKRSLGIKCDDPVEPEERQKDSTVCAGEEITLIADSAGHYYDWSTGETTQQIKVTPTLIGGTEEYSVRVYDYKIEASNNLMANGDFENYTDYHQRPSGFTSDYEYLPFDPTASGLYDTYKDKNGVYLLSCDANHTWKGYAPVKPHGGKYFAMFDAAQSGFAWRVSTNDNPNMKLMQGAKYIFSYWAADLNTGSERNHPAELQFSINYKDDATGQMTKEYLGTVLVLGKDNKWHYSETFWTAPCNSSYIEIGVEDANPYAGPGNDFGLDDIIFQMVTGRMEYTIDKQKWVLTVEDCTPEECVEERIYSKWNDLLLVDNVDYRYTAYQWYCDGVAIPGATGQYYYEEGKVLAGDGHTYHCVATLAAGGQEELCAMAFNDFPTAVSQGRHPMPGQIRVYTPAGKLLYMGADENNILSRLYPGYYLIYREHEDGEITTEKLLIY